MDSHYFWLNKVKDIQKINNCLIVIRNKMEIDLQELE